MAAQRHVTIARDPVSGCYRFVTVIRNPATLACAFARHERAKAGRSCNRTWPIIGEVLRAAANYGARLPDWVKVRNRRANPALPVRPQLRTSAASLDHLVGGDKQSLWYLDAERLGGLEIDEQFDFRGLLDWQVRRLFSFQNATSVDTGQAIDFWTVASVAS